MCEKNLIEEKRSKILSFVLEKHGNFVPLTP